MNSVVKALRSVKTEGLEFDSLFGHRDDAVQSNTSPHRSECDAQAHHVCVHEASKCSIETRGTQNEENSNLLFSKTQETKKNTEAFNTGGGDLAHGYEGEHVHMPDLREQQPPAASLAAGAWNTVHGHEPGHVGMQTTQKRDTSETEMDTKAGSLVHRYEGGHVARMQAASAESRRYVRA
jgi:hypothetical protein